MANQAENATASASGFLSFFVVCFKEPHVGVFFLYSLMTLCSLVAAPANVWCLWFHLRTERGSRPAPVFSLNRAVVDLVFCLESLLEMLNAFVFKNAGLYSVIVFFFGISWIGRSLLQTCICVEQYMAVVYPVTFLRLRGVHYRLCVAGACWAMGAGYGLYLTYTNMFPDMVFISVFFVVVSVISFCCASVLCALKGPGPGDRHSGDQRGAEAGNLQKRNAFNIIFRVLIVTLFTYSPQIIIMFLILNIKTVFCLCDLNPFLTSIYVLNVAVTPLLMMYKEGHLHLKRRNLSNS